MVEKINHKSLVTTSFRISLSQSEEEVIKHLKKKSALLLTKRSHKNALKILKQKGVIESYTGIINPYALKDLPGDTRYYIFTVDAEESRAYFHVKEFLLRDENRQRMTSYCTIGEKDFVCIYYGNITGLERIIKQLIEYVLEKSDRDLTGFIDCYEIIGALIMGGFPIQKDYPSVQGLDPVKISAIQKDYRKVKEEYIKSLEEKGVFVGYTVIYDFLKLGKLRAVVLFWFPKFGVDARDVFSKNSLKAPVVHCFSTNSTLTQFGNPDLYLGANLIVISEFDELGEYSKWMDEIYQSVNGINAFTLLIESRISERPFSVGDYFEFMKLCSEYTYPQASQKIHLGHPIFLEHFREKKTNIDLDVLNGHGLVCGKPDSGKSNSVIVLSLALAKKGITVHLLDVKGDLTEELRKKSEVTTELDLVDVDLNLILQGNQLDLDSCKSQSIYLYALNKLTDDERVSVANSLLNSLQRTQRSKALRHIVFFEEAHKIFTQEQKRLIANLSAAVNIVREMGIGIYLIVQELTRIPFLEVRGELLYLYNQLQNRIIHAVYDSPEEKNIAVRLLVPTGVPKERLFYDIESEITRLSKGEAFVSFLSSDKKPQPPIKIEFLKEKA